jgi:hypothetical protein
LVEAEYKEALVPGVAESETVEIPTVPVSLNVNGAS